MHNLPSQRLTIECLTLIQIELEFGNVGFEEWGNRSTWRKTSQSKDENQQQNQYSVPLFFLFEQETSSGDQSIINLSLRSKLKQLRFIGRMIGFAVCQDLLLNLQLSKPFVKQVQYGNV